MATEYAFDVQLTAVIRVIADSEAEARTKLSTVDAISPSDLSGNDMELKEFSLSDSARTARLFETNDLSKRSR